MCKYSKIKKNVKSKNTSGYRDMDKGYSTYTAKIHQVKYYEIR
jgi:hypothetical protein